MNDIFLEILNVHSTTAGGVSREIFWTKNLTHRRLCGSRSYSHDKSGGLRILTTHRDWYFGDYINPSSRYLWHNILRPKALLRVQRTNLCPCLTRSAWHSIIYIDPRFSCILYFIGVVPRAKWISARHCRAMLTVNCPPFDRDRT